MVGRGRKSVKNKLIKELAEAVVESVFSFSYSIASALSVSSEREIPRACC